MHTATIRRAVPVALTAAALLFGGAACGGDKKVDRNALINKIKSDKANSQGMTDAQVGCAADVFIKYIDADALNKYVKNGTELPPPKDAKNKDKAESELSACESAK